MVTLTYTRAVSLAEIEPLITCQPGPRPTVDIVAGRTPQAYLRFDDGIATGVETRLRVEGIRGGNPVALTILRLPEPKVSVKCLDRPELLVTWPSRADDPTCTLSPGTSRFRLEFSRPMDRSSVEATLRQSLAGADRAAFRWESDTLLNLAVTCDSETDRLEVLLEGARCQAGVTVTCQPFFRYRVRRPYRVMEALPDGSLARELGTISGELDFGLMSPDHSWVAYTEIIGGGESGADLKHFARPVAGGPLVELVDQPLGWTSDSQVLCGFSLSDARTGAVLRHLPGQKPVRWWGSLSPSGRFLAVLHSLDWRRVTMVLYDLQTWTMRDLGEVTGYLPVEGGAFIMPPAWSPDERRVAMLEVRPDRSSNLAVLDLETMELVAVPGVGHRELGGAFRWTAWSPDGRYIFHVAGRGMAVVTPEGETVCAVEEPKGLPGRAFWSPDSSRVLYSSRYGPSQVWVVDIGRGAEHRVGSGIALGWSTDGSRVLWATRE